MRVSDASNHGRAKASDSETGVLANLPRTRPQRASPRRAAARKAASASNVAKAKASAQTPGKASAKASTRTSTSTGGRASERPSPAKAKAARTKRSVSTIAREDAVPRQGYEADGEIASGSVQPPGASELVSSAAELAGELAKAGVSGGARLLKDLFARLPPG
jgi:hypothetical protein